MSSSRMPSRLEWWTNQVHMRENLDLLDFLPLFDLCSRDPSISLWCKGNVNHVRSMQNLIQKMSSLSKPTTIGSSIKYLDEKTVTVNRRQACVNNLTATIITQNQQSTNNDWWLIKVPTLVIDWGLIQSMPLTDKSQLIEQSV